MRHAIILFLLLAINFGFANLVSNGNFEAGKQPWTYGVPAGTTGKVEIIDGGDCETGKCLKVILGNAQVAYAYQHITIALTPGATYTYKARFKAAADARARMGLFDPDWKDANCAVKPKFLYTTFGGTGDWYDKTFTANIPLVDDCGQSTANHKWRAYLYSVAPNLANSPVFYDSISLEAGRSASEADLEETLDWSTGCRTYSNTRPLINCKPNARVMDTAVKLSGGASMRITTPQTDENTYNAYVTVEPNTLYRASASFKMSDRKCYNYLDYNYPTSWLVSLNARTQGIICGRYLFDLVERQASVEGKSVSLLPQSINDYPYASNTQLDWFDQEVYFKTGPNTDNIRFKLVAYGLDAKFYIDSLKLQKVGSAVDLSGALTPVPYDFGGMKLISASTSLVVTNAASFAVSQNTITINKNAVAIGSIVFSNVEILSDLQLDSSVNGVARLYGAGGEIVIGADSSIFARLDKSSKVVVKGPKPTTYAFEGGVIFATDGEKGILFSPLRTEGETETMPFTYVGENRTNPTDFGILDVKFNNEELASQGYSVGRVLKDFNDQAGFEVEYDFVSGEGFSAAAFPPKEFDMVKYCKERSDTLSPFSITAVAQAPYNIDAIKYEVQRMSEKYSIPIIYMFSYARSDNNPQTSYLRTSPSPSVYVGPSQAGQPNVVAKEIYPVDVQGPFAAGELDLMQLYTAEAKKRGMKTVAYLSPQVYYTEDIDRLIENIRNLRSESGVDGVYFDGVLPFDPIKYLEFMRRTRSELSNGYFVQHASWVNSYTLPRTNHLRVPFLDAYADMLWAGEGIKDVDENSWKIDYCGYSSGTPTTILADIRPIDYPKGKQYNLDNMMEPEIQWRNSLACNGQFRSNIQYPSQVIDKRLSISRTYDPAPYWNALDDKCLSVTCGDGICDVGESILTCAGDCSPEHSELTLSLQGTSNKFIYDSSKPAVQWVVGGRPLYHLRFTFDGDIVSEESGHKIYPYYQGSINLSRALNPINPPKAQSLDGRKAFYFDGTMAVGSDFRHSFDNPSQYSVMAKAKRANATSNDREVFFNISSTTDAKGFTVGFKNKKIEVAISSQGVYQVFEGKAEIADGDWHSLGFSYSNGRLVTFLDGKADREILVNADSLPTDGYYIIGRPFAKGNANAFSGWLDDLLLSGPTTAQQASYYHAGNQQLATSTRQVEVVAQIDGKLHSATVSGAPGKPGMPSECGNEFCEIDETYGSCPADCVGYQKPDLTVSGPRLLSTQVGSELKFSIEVSNAGDALVGLTTTFVSPSATFATQGILPDQSQVLDVSYFCASAGTQVATIKADYENEVEEKDEGNNWLEITVECIPAADSIPTPIVSPWIDSSGKFSIIDTFLGQVIAPFIEAISGKASAHDVSPYDSVSPTRVPVQAQTAEGDLTSKFVVAVAAIVALVIILAASKMKKKD